MYTTCRLNEKEYKMLLPNGSAIHLDIIASFEKAVVNPENLHEGGGVNWNFVDADLCMDLSGSYSHDHLYECFEVLVDNYFA